MRLKRLYQSIPTTFLRFATVGVINTLVDLGLFLLLNGSLGVILANIVAYSTGIMVSYTLNRFWTYHGRASQQATWQFIQFVLVSLSAMLLNTILVFGFSWIMHGDQTSLKALFAKAGAIVGSALWNYTLNTYWTFKSDHAPLVIHDEPLA
ncbi:MAG: GtrA family protein [Herpetosiphon sp.]|nr:GtrA family protein [Herpetosiphon sp.]